MMNAKVASKVEGFFEQYPLKRYPKGHILIYANEDPEYIFYLASGKVRVYDINQQGNEIEVQFYKPPSFFPMSWAINKTPNEYFYSADNSITVRQAPVEDSVKFLKANKDVLLDLLSRVYKGIDEVLRRMAHVMGGTSYNRVLFELVVESNRTKMKPDGKYVLEFGEANLAKRAGLSRETVSRVMKDLKSKKIVEISRNSITILDLDRLAKVLDHLL